MKRYGSYSLICFCLFIFVVIVTHGCSREVNNEIAIDAHFIDGQFFEYEVETIRSTGEIGIDKSAYKIVNSKLDEYIIYYYRFDNLFTEYIVGKDGKVKEAISYYPKKKHVTIGNNVYSPLWLPTKNLNIGDRINGVNIINRKDIWGDWNVLVLEGGDGYLEYFDYETGYFVGSTNVTNTKLLIESMGELPQNYIEEVTTTLINSNISIPIVKEHIYNKEK